LRPYVTGVHFFLTPLKATEKDEWNIDRQNFRANEIKTAINLAQQQGIPVSLYNDKNSWMLQDARRRLPLDSVEARALLGGAKKPETRDSNEYQYLTPWMELMRKQPGDALDKDADRLAYNIRYYGDQESQLRNNLHNAGRDPTNPDYRNIVLINQYMRKNRLLNTKELVKHLKDKWGAIKERDSAKAQEPVAEDTVDEMALSTYKTMGDFDKPGPFTGADKKLVPHAKNIEKATKFFEQNPYDFRLFFSNIPGTGKYGEYGPMTPDQIRKIFGADAEEIIQGSEDAITVVYVGNRGEAKVMLTPWVMAHRLGHAIQAGARGTRTGHVWTSAEKHFFTTVNSTLAEHYGKVDRGPSSYLGRPKAEQANINLTPEYNALFNAIGTQRSSRSGQILRPYEFLYEIFAQYLGTGKITFNPLPANLTYGRKAFGNPSKFMNIKPEYRDEFSRKEAADRLAYDMEIMFDSVLSGSVGKILVM
jgi:hypothetical protein